MKFLSFHGSFLIPFDCLHYSMILSKSQQNIFLIFQQKSWLPLKYCKNSFEKEQFRGKTQGIYQIFCDEKWVESGSIWRKGAGSVRWEQEMRWKGGKWQESTERKVFRWREPHAIGFSKNWAFQLQAVGNKSFLIQQFFKNAGEVWASSPHLRSKLFLRFGFQSRAAGE